jgi:hypothetical protein
MTRIIIEPGSPGEPVDVLIRFGGGGGVARALAALAPIWDGALDDGAGDLPDDTDSFYEPAGRDGGGTEAAAPATRERPDPTPSPSRGRHAGSSSVGAHGLLTAATSPDGRLFQLQHVGRISGRRGGAYIIAESDSDGNLSRCKGRDLPCPSATLDIAAANFIRWAQGRGYEVMGYRPPGAGATGAEEGAAA